MRADSSALDTNFRREGMYVGLVQCSASLLSISVQNAVLAVATISANRFYTMCLTINFSDHLLAVCEADSPDRWERSRAHYLNK